jgi:phosphate transport system permease protein
MTQVETIESERAQDEKGGVSHLGRRRIIDKIATLGILVAVALAIIPLALILIDIVVNAAPVMSLTFLTGLPSFSPFEPGQGISNSIVGSFVMVGVASLIAIPIGIGAGIYLSEWRESRFASLASFTNDMLAEFPSIVIGIFVYLVIVVVYHFSALAGAIALAILMIPVVVRTTEESLKLVPMSLREASMALGVSRWRTIVRIVLSTGRGGLITGILLAVARAIGETAPLLITAFGSSVAFKSLLQPTNSLSLLIFYYATSGFKPWIQQAWGAALILVIIVLGLNVTVRVLTRGKFVTGVE